MPDRQSIIVNAQRQYAVTIGNDLKKEVASFIVGLEKARHVILVHQPTLKESAKSLESELSLAGLVVTLAEIPDAEAGKTVTVLEKLWHLCGENNIARTDVVVGLGGGAAPSTCRLWIVITSSKRNTANRAVTCSPSWERNSSELWSASTSPRH